jgi:UDP-N-acetylmuramate--alanine ligase
LGGISSNFNSNYIKNSGKSDDTSAPIVIVEADEFDRSFHKLFPNAAIITAIDADHLDIYETKEAFEEAFHIFARQVQKSDRNSLFVNQDLNWPKELTTQSYGFAANSDYAIGNIQIKEGSYHFEITNQQKSFAFKAGLPGYHNVLNAGAAIALCNSYLNIPLADLVKPIANFKGVKRRFEYLVNQPMAVVIDDYAHHPEELNMIINSVKDLYPEKKITGVFQPHLFSRTQDFAQEFAQSLEQLDQLYLLEIYPAREKPIPGITSSYIVSLMQKEGAQVISKEAFLDVVRFEKPEVLLILGAGDIDTLRQPLIEIYE